MPAKLPGTERKTYSLTEEQIKQLQRLPLFLGFGFRFWYSIASELGIDVRSILCQPLYRFTALPLGHGQHWCYPNELKCRVKPAGWIDKS